MINVTCSLQEKNSIYQAVLSYKEDNKWKTKWISTKIKATKKNKREAELKLENIKNNFYSELNKNCLSEQNISTNSDKIVENEGEKIQFIDFMKEWLEMIRPSIEETTYYGYSTAINGNMSLYFQNKNIELKKIKAIDIQKFYQYLINIGLTGNTVRHYHANIRKALQYAVKTEIIEANPADRVELPKMETYTAQYYTKEEIRKLFKITKNTKLETPVLLAAFYGLRRSEIVGLKWNAVDFKKKTISINHVINQIAENHTSKIIKKDRTKTKSSRRTLPLFPEIEKYLLDLKQRQLENQVKYGKKYNSENSEYICIDETGKLLTPNLITHSFRRLLIKNKFKVHRFHDLRHSVASLLLNEGINMKQIQVWLGHSNYSTTANIYAHLDTSGMIKSADVISKAIGKK